MPPTEFLKMDRYKELVTEVSRARVVDRERRRTWEGRPGAGAGAFVAREGGWVCIEPYLV